MSYAILDYYGNVIAENLEASEISAKVSELVNIYNSFDDDYTVVNMNELEEQDLEFIR